MKNSVLSLLAAAALMACNKKDTTTMNNTGDSTAMEMVSDSAGMAMDNTMPSDSATAGTAMKSKAELNMQDKSFAYAAAKGGMMEVMMGQLAATNASSSAVKNLGAMMVKDHTKANDELKMWASSVGYTLPATMDADQQKMYDDLKMKKGADFDKAYTAMMVADHKKDVAAFKQEASKGMDPSLKAFAEKTVPTLEHHLSESQKAMMAVK